MRTGYGSCISIYLSRPDLIEDDLTEELAEHTPYLTGMRSAADLKRLSMQDVLLGGLSWTQRQQLDDEAPTHIQVPSGSRIPVDYSRPEDPALAVKIYRRCLDNRRHRV